MKVIEIKIPEFSRRSDSTLTALMDASSQCENLIASYDEESGVCINYYLPIEEGEDIPKPIKEPFELTRVVKSHVYQLGLDDIRINGTDVDISEPAKVIITSVIPTLTSKINKECIKALSQYAGLLPTGNETELLPMHHDSMINPIQYFAIKRRYEDAGFSEPFIIGGENCYLSRQAGVKSVYYEAYMNTAFDNDFEHVVTFDPNSIKIISYSEHSKTFKVNEGIILYYDPFEPKIIKGTIYDTYSKQGFDLLFKYDESEMKWVFWYIFKFDIFRLIKAPVNGIMHFKVCSNKIPICPSPDPITPSNP